MKSHIEDFLTRYYGGLVELEGEITSSYGVEKYDEVSDSLFLVLRALRWIS